VWKLISYILFLDLRTGGEALVIEKLERQGLMGPRTPLLEHSSGIRAMVPHPIPLCWCIEPWELGRPFYNAVKFGIVQYVSSSVFLKCILIGFFSLFCWFLCLGECFEDILMSFRDASLLPLSFCACLSALHGHTSDNCSSVCYWCWCTVIWLVIVSWLPNWGRWYWRLCVPWWHLCWSFSTSMGMGYLSGTTGMRTACFTLGFFFFKFQVSTYWVAILEFRLGFNSVGDSITM